MPHAFYFISVPFQEHGSILYLRFRPSGPFSYPPMCSLLLLQEMGLGCGIAAQAAFCHESLPSPSESPWEGLRASSTTLLYPLYP